MKNAAAGAPIQRIRREAQGRSGGASAHSQMKRGRRGVPRGGDGRGTQRWDTRGGGAAPMLLSLSVFDCPVTIQCEDADTRALLVANYGHLQGPLHQGGLRYFVSRPSASQGR
jgi:hypothetical protein